MGVLRSARACTTFHCECPRAGSFYLLDRSRFHILLSVGARQNKRVGWKTIAMIAETHPVSRLIQDSMGGYDSLVLFSSHV